MLKRVFLHKKGQGLVEYALILVLIAILSIAALTILGSSVSDVFSQIYAQLTGGASGGGGGGTPPPPPGGTCYGSLLLPYLIGSTILFLLIFRLGPQRSTVAMGA